MRQPMGIPGWWVPFWLAKYGVTPVFPLFASGYSLLRYLLKFDPSNTAVQRTPYLPHESLPSG